MLSLMLHHAATLAACVAIGVATAWWTFRSDKGGKP